MHGIVHGEPLKKTSRSYTSWVAWKRAVHNNLNKICISSNSPNTKLICHHRKKQRVKSDIGENSGGNLRLKKTEIGGVYIHKKLLIVY